MKLCIDTTDSELDLSVNGLSFLESICRTAKILKGTGGKFSVALKVAFKKRQPVEAVPMVSQIKRRLGIRAAVTKHYTHIDRNCRDSIWYKVDRPI